MFVDEVKHILKRNNWTSIDSPWNLVEAWKSFGEQVESGYDLSIYEYDNDISVRNVIEYIIQDTGLSKYPEYNEFVNQVSIIDEEFKNLLSSEFFRENQKFWWEKGILKRAGKEYAEDILNLHGKKIEVIE